MMLTKEQQEQLLKDVEEIKVALKGYNGYEGLCSSHSKLKADFYCLRRQLWLAVGFAIGSGIISTGLALGIPELLSR